MLHFDVLLCVQIAWNGRQTKQGIPMAYTVSNEIANCIYI